MNAKQLSEVKERALVPCSRRIAQGMEEDLHELIAHIEVHGDRPLESRRGLVYAAIDSERHYQDKREGEISSDGEPGDGSRTVHEFVHYVSVYTRFLSEESLGEDAKEGTMDTFRKIAALCVAAMEQHGAQPR